MKDSAEGRMTAGTAPRSVGRYEIEGLLGAGTHNGRRPFPLSMSAVEVVRPAGGRVQGIALVRGKGRVVMLGEAAMLSAQIFLTGGMELRLGMEHPGCNNRQLALTIMHWLPGLLN